MKRRQDTTSAWRDAITLWWLERDNESWFAPAAFAFAAAVVVAALILAMTTGDLWFLLLLVWPAYWLVMWLLP